MERNIKKRYVADPIDVYVGGQVRYYRTLQGMSQTDIANAIGVKFQQVQKYESGSNRISSSRLFHMGVVLNMRAGVFFEGISKAALNENSNDCSNQSIDLKVDNTVLCRETLEFVRLFKCLSKKNKGIIRQLIGGLTN